VLRVGIIGCGKIADSHAAIIRELPDCEIVGVCDTEELMALQLSERFNVKHYFSDAKRLVESCHPDVVHITTPPQSHFSLAKLCMEMGCHVYVEKPFTITASETQTLVDLATRSNLKLTVGTDAQFSPVARRLRKLVQQGILGGPPFHMESCSCYDLGNAQYAKSFLGDNNHWVRKLPGKLLHNIISHGIAKIAEFIVSDNPHVLVHGHSSPLLRDIHEDDIIDELRVIISDDDNATAYFTFSSQIYPSQQLLRLYGPKCTLIADDVQQTLLVINHSSYKSYLRTFIPPLIYAKQYVGNTKANISAFIRNEFHFNSGMKSLIRLFYESIKNNLDPPISYREIILTSLILDSIFNRINLIENNISNATGDTPKKPTNTD
jgi:predicted dehydrogenase